MIFDKVAQIIAKVAHCNIQDVKPESELTALGVDSLKAITVIFEIEETFDVEIPNEAIKSIVTVSDILDKLDKLINQDESH